MPFEVSFRFSPPLWRYYEKTWESLEVAVASLFKPQLVGVKGQRRILVVDDNGDETEIHNYAYPL